MGLQNRASTNMTPIKSNWTKHRCKHDSRFRTNTRAPAAQPRGSRSTTGSDVVKYSCMHDWNKFKYSRVVCVTLRRHCCAGPSRACSASCRAQVRGCELQTGPRTALAAVNAESHEAWAPRQPASGRQKTNFLHLAMNDNLRVDSPHANFQPDRHTGLGASIHHTRQFWSP